MKRFLTTLTGIAALVLLSQVSFAQEDKEKDKEKSRSRNEEIIIKRKTDKDTKVTIEIKGDEVLVNGKPTDEYDDENISIRKRRTVIATVRTPFRSQGGVNLFSDDYTIASGGNTAFLGVTTEDHSKGAKIEQITDESAAQKAGLKAGDVITKIDDTEISSPDDVTKAIRKHKPEEKATITYLRDGKEQKVTVTLGKRKGVAFDMYAPNIKVNPNFDLNWDNNGFGNSYSFSNRGRLGVKAQDTEEGKGVKVLSIDEASAAEKAGLKKDDVITEFDGKTINSTDELAKAARDSREKSSVTVKFDRGGKSQTAEIKTPRKLKTTNL